MGFPILVRRHLYIESGPWCSIYRLGIVISVDIWFDGKTPWWVFKDLYPALVFVTGASRALVIQWCGSGQDWGPLQHAEVRGVKYWNSCLVFHIDRWINVIVIKYVEIFSRRLIPFCFMMQYRNASVSWCIVVMHHHCDALSLQCINVVMH